MGFCSKVKWKVDWMKVGIHSSLGTWNEIIREWMRRRPWWLRRWVWGRKMGGGRVKDNNNVQIWFWEFGNPRRYYFCLKRFWVTHQTLAKLRGIQKLNLAVSSMNTSLAAPGALAHRLQRCTACNAALPATPHCLQNPKWPPVGPKMADGVWKGVYP